MTRTTRVVLATWAAMAALSAAGAGRAATVLQRGDARVDLGGHVKTFSIAVIPYDHLLMPDDPLGMAVLDARLRLEGSKGDWLRFGFHEQVTLDLQSAPFATALAPAAPGGGGDGGVPEAADMSWTGVDADLFHLGGRVDRAWVTLRAPHLDITLGRQPLSFGNAFFFTPMDLVAPFSPTVIDREYKPGIDAIRADAFIGMSTRVTAVAAYAGGWDRDGTILAAHGVFTVRITDVGLFAGRVHGDAVLGADASSAIGPVGVRAEGTVTWPADDDEDPFVRAVVGADHSTAWGLSLMAEVYYQSVGRSDPDDYLEMATSERFTRGELWALGQWYAALNASYELTPLVILSLAAVANLGDPSLLLAPGLAWSIAGNADLSVGAYVGVGERPGDVDPDDPELWGPKVPLNPPTEEDILAAIPVRSEFGLTPSMVFVQVSAYF